jgi:polar amino acid transport system substrate-binding protein
MTSDELMNMFELFYTTKAKGSGIGMSLSKQMIEENHGTIEVLSEKYQGTTVRLIFGGEL